VAPLADETALRNYDRVVRNRALVDRLSNGRIGYVALTDFEGEGWGEFVRQFYPQAGEDGLVIDVRWNLGGFTSQAVLEVLHRQLAGVFVNREASVSPLPVVVPPRTMVALMNWGSGSDGDQFPYYFRRYGLGPLVGTRSWGGVQGLNRPWSLMDGTGLTIPKDSLADPTGHWIIENTGVTPDTVIDDRPEEGATGRDNQLETATRIAMARLATHPALKGTAPAPLPAYPPTGNVPGASFVHSLQ
jgi:tricorn protease